MLYRVNRGLPPIDAGACWPGRWLLALVLISLPVAALAQAEDDRIDGLSLQLAGRGSASVTPMPLYPGGPSTVGLLSRDGRPPPPLISHETFELTEYGALGVRDFQVMTGVSGKARMYDGYYYAILSGQRWPPGVTLTQDQLPHTKQPYEKALLWTRSRSLDGPWDKPQILLKPNGPWRMVDQGSLVQSDDGQFVLMLRAVTETGSGLYVLQSESPTEFTLPTENTPPVLTGADFQCLPPPGDNLCVPQMIKLSDQSHVGGLPGTEGAFVAYCMAWAMRDGQKEWFIYGAYSLDHDIPTKWVAMNGGKPILSPSGQSGDAWAHGVADARIIEVGPNQFALGVSAFGRNLPDYATAVSSASMLEPMPRRDGSNQRIGSWAKMNPPRRGCD